MAKQRQIGLTSWLAKTKRFLEELPAECVDTRPLVRKLHSVTQFIYLVVQGFVANRCPLRAAALCYTTLLALVPEGLISTTLTSCGKACANPLRPTVTLLTRPVRPETLIVDG